jgi:hypothetical protein
MDARKRMHLRSGATFHAHSMPFTKQSVIDKHRSTQQAAAAAGCSVRKRGPINIKAARILSSQEVAMLPPVKPARSSQDEESSDADDDEEVRTPPCDDRSAHQYFALSLA